MIKESPLEGKMILAVDDEPDVLESIEEELDMCILHKAKDYDTAIQYLLGYTYDIVILDIMGVNGFELLKVAVTRGFPTIMLSAHAVTPDTIKKINQTGCFVFPSQGKIGTTQGIFRGSGPQ